MRTKLIDAYSLLEVIRESREKNPHGDSKIRANHTIEHDHIAHKVLEQPAAYDVDKVVNGLNEMIEDNVDMDTGERCENWVVDMCNDLVLKCGEIVKSGLKV